MITVRIRRNGDAARVLERIRRGLAGPKHVKVGLPNGSDPEQLEKLLFNEFGAAGGASGGGWGGPIPERPAFRNALRDNRGKYKRFVVSEAKKILAGRADMRQSLNRLGLVAVGDVQTSIVNLSSPPNSPVTIERKGSSNPLVDSGAMRQAITHKVEDP